MSLRNSFSFPVKRSISTFLGTSGLGSYAWIGIVPSDITHGSESANDLHDIQYAYVGGMTDEV